MPSPFFYFLTTCKGLEQEVTHQLIWAYLFNSPTVVEIVFGLSPAPQNSYCRREPDKGICDLEIYDPEGKPLIGIELKMWSYVSEAQRKKQQQFIKKRREELNANYRFRYLLLGTSQYELTPCPQDNYCLITATKVLQFLKAIIKRRVTILQELQKLTDYEPWQDESSLQLFLEEYHRAIANQQEWLENHWKEKSFQPYTASYFMRNLAVQKALKEKERNIDAIVYRNDGNNGFGLQISAGVGWPEIIEVEGTEGQLILKLEHENIALLWHPTETKPPTQKVELAQLRDILDTTSTELKRGNRSGKEYSAVARLKLPKDHIWDVEWLVENLVRELEVIGTSDFIAKLKAK